MYQDTKRCAAHGAHNIATQFRGNAEFELVSNFEVAVPRWVILVLAVFHSFCSYANQG